MHDIVDRLRDRSFSTKARDPLCEEAAAEIERLRNGATCPHVRGTVTQHCSLNFTLTAEERQAIEFAVSQMRITPLCMRKAKTIRSLLERLA
jgi:hypothetical protein